jgi:pimeloyl-ACP methyl ester carboxylesterase
VLLAGLVALALIASVLVLARGTRTIEGIAGGGPKVEQRGPAGTAVPGLERFYAQRLLWSGCEPFATGRDERAAFRVKGVECARVDVPLDYAKPDGDIANLGLLRRPAGDRGRRIGSLLVNPGGPGASGMVAAASLSKQVGESELGARFDLVGFDPRGVGASIPAVRCLTTEERDAERLDLDVDTSPEGVAQTERENADYAAKCEQRVGSDLLANVGTRDVARDLDIIRSVLGDQKLTYLGYSYGTRIGAAYAQSFPGSVRAMVLDGALDPSQSPVDEVVEQTGAFQSAFQAYAQRCASDGDCPLGADPARAAAEFRKLVGPLIERPIEVKERKLSYTDAITGVIAALYDDQLWDLLDQGLEELAKGEGVVLLYLADSYYGRSGGEYSTLTDAFNAIHCVDDPPLTDRAAVREADRRARAAAPFLDDGQPPSSALDVCAFWAVPPTSTPDVPTLTGLPPTIVISTTGDPATPYEAGIALAEALGGRLLTNEGTQHTAFLQGIECVDNAAIAYLIDGTLPAEGTRCP